MAKRKTASKAASKTKAAKTARSKKAAPARKAGKPATRKTPRKAKKAPARPARKATPRKVVKAARKPVKAAPKKKATPKKPAPKKAPAKKVAPKKPAPKKAAPKAARKPAAAPVRKAAPPVAKAPAKPRKAPALERERRTIADEDAGPTPPSSLDLDRTASAVRSGRHEAEAHRREVTQTSPDITAGDVDADWEAAYSVGDEAPGGDNPTPDQDVVDEIGQALGMEYADDEELGGEGKLADRDADRWELDPESSEDFEDRDE